MVDWIETIPIAETRTYVQRVLFDPGSYRGQTGPQLRLLAGQRPGPLNDPLDGAARCSSAPLADKTAAI